MSFLQIGDVYYVVTAEPWVIWIGSGGRDGRGGSGASGASGGSVVEPRRAGIRDQEITPAELNTRLFSYFTSN